MFGWFKKSAPAVAPTPKYWSIPNHAVIERDTKFHRLSMYHQYIDKKTVAIPGSNALDGSPVFMDMATAPHVLVAGTTGSGKSVSVNSILCSLLAKNSPDDLKLYIADPKMVDYNAYKGLPHLVRYSTGINDTAETLEAIKNIMMARYEKMQKIGVSNVAELPEKLPRILFVMDEFASLMNKEGKAKIVPTLQEILRLGRAAGVHCILATQRPDRTVIDGQLKANCPSRLCFRVQSSTDSRVILDHSGGEKLRGMGDGIYLKSNGDFYRFQGLYLSKDEQNKVLDWWKEQV